MAVFTVTINSYGNLPPSQIGNITINLSYNETYVFSIADFTTGTTPIFADPEGDGVSTVKIVTIPTQGVLYLSAVAVIDGQDITLANITAGNLTYIADVGDTDGYINSIMTFDIADDGSLTYSGLTPGVVTFDVLAKDNVPPVIGDGAATIDYGETLIFTSAMFTSATTPPYSDFEGDPAFALKILTLPALGQIRYNGTPSNVNDIIYFTDISLGLLTYVPDLADIDGDVQGFTFAIADSVSPIFST